MGNQKILLVEDEANLSRLLTDVLACRGYQNVQVANDGYQGLERYKEHKPSLVLMDLEMPVMNGYDSSREIKKYDPNANIVLITGSPRSLIAQRTLNEGYVTQILEKPFSFDELLQTIEASLAASIYPP